MSGKKVAYAAFLIVLVCARFTLSIVYYVWRCDSLILRLLRTFALTLTCLSSINAVTWSDLDPMRTLTIVFASVSATLDLILAASMIYLLNKSRTGIQKTNALLSRLIVLTLSTGLLSAMVSMAQITLVNYILCLPR